MPDLTTRDVFEQVHTRLSRVEDDLRALRVEMNERFTDIRQEMRDGFRDVDVKFRWLVGIMLTSWVTIMGAIIGVIWLK